MQDNIWNAGRVEVELMKAGRTLMALHVPGTRPAQERSCMPAHVYELEDIKGWFAEVDDVPPGPPTARQIAHMDLVMAWLTMIPRDRVVLRKIVGARMLCRPEMSDRDIEWMVERGRAMVSFKSLAARLHCSDMAIGRWHRTAIEMIVTRLNASGLCSRSGGPIGPSRYETDNQVRRAMVLLRHRQRVPEPV